MSNKDFLNEKVTVIRMLDDGNGQILPDYMCKPITIKEIISLLKTDEFIMDVKDKQSLILELERRDELYSDDIENSTFEILKWLDQEKSYGYNLYGNMTDKIVLYMDDEIVFETGTL